VFGEPEEETRYLMLWKVEGHHLAHLDCVMLEADNSPLAVYAAPPSGRPVDSESAFTVTVKWDECCDFRIAPAGDDGYVHTCSPAQVAALAGALVYAQTRGLQILKARENLGLFG